MRKEDVGVECGSGKSSLWLAQQVQHLCSVEHSADWFNKVKKNIQTNNISNIEYHYKPKQEDYVRVINQFAANSLDFILIDGEWRDDCAVAAIEKVKVGGMIILDNANWYIPWTSYSPNSRLIDSDPASPLWAIFLNKVANWRLIWTTNGVWDTAIFLKRHE